MIDNWEKLQSETLQESDFSRLEKKSFRTPGGDVHEYFVHGNDRAIVSVVALTPDKRFILAREFRVGPERVLDEIPGGLVDPGEDIEPAAARELLEETGFRGELTHVVTTYTSAYSPKVKHCFVALNCEKVGEPESDHDEYIEVVLMSYEEFVAHVEKGELSALDAALAGLRYLEKHSVV